VTIAAVLRAAALAVLLAGCAEIAPPPGGDVDRTPPALLAVTPPNGATNVPLSDRVVLRFSERVLAPQTGKAFFISPHLRAEPTVKWRGDRIEIIFPDSFQANQTYIIALSSAISDLRNNVFDSAGVIAFSTGATLDSGRVAGTVLGAGGSPQGGLLAGLYDATLFTDSTVWDSLFPTYLTQTNQQGQFSFAYLPDRPYRLVVFQDRNRNERFNPARESFALADRPVIVGGALRLSGLRLGLTTTDTTTAHVLSATFTADRLLRLRLDRPVATDHLSANPQDLALVSLADTTVRVTAQAILEQGEETSATLTAWLGSPDSGLYRVTAIYDPDRPPMAYDSLRIAGAEDQTAPQLVAFAPAGPGFLRDLDLRLTVSEPLDTSAITPETFVLWREPDTMRVPLAWSWKDVFHLTFGKESLREGEGYRLAVTEFDLKDRAGNVAGDSLREYRFNTLDVDSLGSITGQVRIGLPDREKDTVELTFKPVGGTGAFYWRGPQGGFTLAAPAGKYLLSGYIDSNGDGALSLGSVDPWRTAETQSAYADTVQVRARFETAGIDFVLQ